MASIVISLTTPSAANGAAVTGYTLYRGTTPGGQSATPIATNVTLPYTDTTAADGVRYYYKAAGVNSAGTGAQSAEVNAVAAAAALPTVTLSAAISKAEGNSGANLYTYTVTRSATTGATSVPWSFTAGSTTAGDFTGGVYPAGGSVALADGVASGMFTVSVVGDTTVEPDETFTVLISTPSGYTAGASTSATGTILNDDVAGGGATFTMTQLAAASRVYQRSTSTGGGQGKGIGTIPVTLNVTAAGAIYARARSAADSTTIVQASFLAVSSAPVANGSVNIPGIDARLGWFFLDLSPDGVTWTNGTVRVGMGRVVAMSGQSLAARAFGKMGDNTTLATLGVAPSANSAVYATYADNQRTVTVPAWTIPADGTNYDSAFAAEFLRLEVAAAGVNCAMVGHAVGSTAINSWIPGGDQVTQLQTILDTVGGFESFNWFQGHSDSYIGSSSYQQYKDKLTLLFNNITAHNGVKGATYSKALMTIPNIDSGLWGDADQINAIRNAAEDWAAANGGTNILANDIVLFDGVHQTQAGSVTLGRHFYRATRPDFGLAHNDNGPRITGVTRAAGSANLVLAITNPLGGTALVATGAPVNKFKVYVAGTATVVALDATTPVTLGTNTITLKLATVPANIDTFDVQFARALDGSAVADQIYDDVTDGDGLTVGRPLRSTLIYARTLYTPPVFARPALSVGNRGASFAASPKSGFGQASSGISYASAPTQGYFGGRNVYAVDAVFSATGTYANGRGWFLGESDKIRIGVDTSGKLMCFYKNGGGDAFMDTSASPLVNDGVPHHVAFSCNGTTAKLYLDGALITSRDGPDGRAGGGFTIGNRDGDGSQQGTFAGKVDEVACWSTNKFPAAFTPPSAPYVGNEVGLIGLFHLDGDFVDSGQ